MLSESRREDPIQWDQDDFQVSVQRFLSFVYCQNIPPNGTYGSSMEHSFRQNSRRLWCFVTKIIRWEASDLFLTVQIAFLDDNLPAGTGTI